MNTFFKNKTAPFNCFGLFVCGLLLFSACKENTILPPDLVPLVDNINTFQQDTFTVLTHTTYDDSLLTGGTQGAIARAADANYAHAIGSISNDLVFGRTYGAAYVQVIPSNTNFSFNGDSVVIDSVVLGINYIKDRAYGDTSSSTSLSPQMFRIFQAENLTNTDAYFEFSKPSSLNLLKTVPVDFNTLRVDSPLVGGQKLRPQFRVDLTTELGASLLAQTASGAYADFSSFLDWFGGFYIEPDSTIGNMLGYFDTDNTTMYVYYRYQESGVPDTAVATFAFDGTHCNRFNHIVRDYTGTPANNFINTGSAAGDSVLFLQGDPGLAGVLNFPYIGSFENSIINKAELTFTVASPYTSYSDTSAFNIPEEIQFVLVNSNGEEDLFPDYTIFGLTPDAIGAAIQRVGATRVWSLLGVSQHIQYKCNITNTIQNAITQQDSDFSLRISGTGGNFPAGSRVVLRGSGSGVTLEKPKLNIIFTKIER